MIYMKTNGLILFIFAFLLTSPLLAQYGAVNGQCSVGGIKAKTQGANSDNTFMGSYPKCTVTVYLTGTATLATIYSNSTGTPLSNPFTAQVNALWDFFAAQGVGYDVVLSGGSPIQFPSSITIPGVTTGISGSSFYVETNPTTSQTITQPINTNFNVLTSGTGYSYETSNKSMFINGIPQADQFAGSDMCAKINTASVYAIANNINQVDATHFYGTQACAYDMLGGLGTPSNTYLGLTVNLGAAHIQSTVQQSITSSGVTLHGMGPTVTQLEYTGTSINAILLVNSATPSYELDNVSVEGIFIYGDVSNATDAILITQTHRSRFDQISTWGVSGCGIHSKFAVTDTFTRPHTSFADATALGIFGSGHTTPASGLCFDQITSSEQTTDGTVTDATAEGLTGIGWNYLGAEGMTNTGGTSEDNATGMVLSTAANVNTIINADFEGNTTGNDYTDNGNRNVVINMNAESSGGTDSVVVGAAAVAPTIFTGRAASSTISPSAAAPTVCLNGQCAFYNLTSAAASGASALTAIADNNTANPQQLTVNGYTNPNQHLFLGYNTASNYGSIQALFSGVGYEPLVLSPSGSGDVLIKTTSDCGQSLCLSGSAQISGHINQQATNDFAGSCTMTATTCTFSLNSPFAGQPLCFVTVQGSAAASVEAACMVSGTTVTITANGTNNNTWGALLIGNNN